MDQRKRIEKAIGELQDLNQVANQLQTALAEVNRIINLSPLVGDIALTTRQAANILGVTPRMIREYHKNQTLLGFRYSERGELKFKASDVFRFLKASQNSIQTND